MSVALAPWYLPMRPVPKPADPTKLAHCSAPSHCLHFAPAAAALVMGGSLFLIPKEDMAFVRMGIAARSASSVVRARVATYGLAALLDLLTGHTLYAVSPLAGTGVAAAAGQRLGVDTIQLPEWEAHHNQRLASLDRPNDLCQNTHIVVGCFLPGCVARSATAPWEVLQSLAVPVDGLFLLSLIHI